MPACGLRFALPWAGILLAALFDCQGASASERISIDGRPDAVRIDVVDARLGDVLEALRARFALHYRSKDGLDTAKTVKLDAPLDRVVARLLQGYDFIITVTLGGVDVLILRQNASTNIVPARAVPTGTPAAPMPIVATGLGYRPERD